MGKDYRFGPMKDAYKLEAIHEQTAGEVAKAQLQVIVCRRQLPSSRLRIAETRAAMAAAREGLVQAKEALASLHHILTTA